LLRETVRLARVVLGALRLLDAFAHVSVNPVLVAARMPLAVVMLQNGLPQRDVVCDRAGTLEALPGTRRGLGCPRFALRVLSFETVTSGHRMLLSRSRRRQ
jgi:hypothetical protein